MTHKGTLNTSKLLNLTEVADVLGVSRKTISKWRANGEFPLPVAKNGKRSYWSPVQINAFSAGEWRKS